MEPTMGLIRPCTKPGCHNKTRGSRERLRDYPTTLLRMKGGVCTDCHQLKEMRCKGCGCQIRPTSIPAVAAPGTKSRYKQDMCKPCWFAAHREAVANEPVCLVTEANLEYTRRGLESFLNRRRERAERYAA